MKQISLLCFLCAVLVSSINAQDFEKSCYNGLRFDTSDNPSWGYGELVVTKVDPYSPAEKAGIKKGDIVMEIDGMATYLRNNETIAHMLFYAELPTITLAMRNINAYFKKYEMEPECIAINSISEKNLSKIFSFYSLENSFERSFSLPTSLETNIDIDYSDYHSFDFVKDKNTTPLDIQITNTIGSILETKGMKHDSKDPDIIVQIYYNYEDNPLFIPASVDNEALYSIRYNSETKKIEKLPILDVVNTPTLKSLGRQIASVGISFYDRKYLDNQKLTQIWDCQIKDYMSDSYPFDKYLKLHIPLIMEEYPYSKAKTNSKYIVEFNKYNYTGLHFDIDDLSLIRDVEKNSPAFVAGIRSGYIIRKINGTDLRQTKSELSEAYKQFIAETMGYRDTSTRFTNANGYSDCMFWNNLYLSQITKAFKKPEHLTHFSYLYGFEKYTGNSSDNVITIEAWDGHQNRIFRIKPIIRESVETDLL